jgi:exosortase
MSAVLTLRHALAPLLPIAVPLLAAYWFVLLPLGAQWAGDPNYAHGFFVPPMAAVLAWRRRERWHATPRHADPGGLVLFAAAAVLYLGGVLAAELFTMRLSFVVAVAAILYTLEGARRLRVMWLPVAFLLAMIPLPYVLYYRLTFPLQLESSRLAATILTAMGLPLLREGNVIHLEGYSLEVVSACSGLRSIMTLGTLALFWNDFVRLSPWLRGVFLLLSVPIAVAANIARLVLTASIAAILGREAAESFLHELSGLVVFVGGMLAIMLCGKGLEWTGRARKS